MARGRLISRTLGSSRKFAALLREAGKLGEFAQALFPMLVSHSDDFGRMAGDAFTVKHAVFPTSPRKESDFTVVLGAMSRVGLIEWYDADGQQVLQIVDFDSHQPGLHKRTASKFPGNSGKFPEIPSQSNRTESKGIEGNRTVGAKTAPGEWPSDPDLDTDVPKQQVGDFIKRFCELYTKHRHGAKFMVLRQKHVPLIRNLLTVYDFKRLEKMAVVLLTTDEPWVKETDRGIGILSVKASWLDNLLSEYEAAHGEIQVAS